jgi:hypothetical protein
LRNTASKEDKENKVLIEKNTLEIKTKNNDFRESFNNFFPEKIAIVKC